MNAQTQITAVAKVPPRSVLIDMSMRYGMEPTAFEQTLRATVVPKDCSKEQFAAFLLVAKEYDLNPLTKEIYAFPKPGGGIQPIVSVDGWCNLINKQPQCDGIEFDDHLTQDNKLTAITARIWRKDRKMPIVVTEYMVECVRDTDTWKKYPRRMLRHKALIQCARYAFGFAGIVDPDEAERIRDATAARVARDDGPPDPSTPMIEHQDSPPTGDTVIWDNDRERAPVEADGLDIPPELDRRPKKLTAAFDVKQWLRDLEGALTACNSVDELTDAQRKVMIPALRNVSEDDKKRAEDLVGREFRRINQTVLGAG